MALSCINSEIKRDIGRKSLCYTPFAFDASFRRYPSKYCHDVWCRKTRMPWLPDGEKIWKICLFFSTESTNVTDRHTHTHTDRLTPHDGIGRSCTASQGKNWRFLTNIWSITAGCSCLITIVRPA